MFTEWEREGYDAQRAGETRQNNPYEPQSKQARDWSWGWHLAKNDEPAQDVGVGVG